MTMALEETPQKHGVDHWRLQNSLTQLDLRLDPDIYFLI